MTCDERLEKLLNKAGQTISDLPKAYSLSTIEAKDIQEVACQWFVNEGAPEGVAFRNLVSIPLYQYILHLTDVIDRMETALENVTRERDWLREMNRLHAGCPTCVHHVDGDPLQCEDGERLCQLGDDRTCVSWEYCGVPEDWRADDENHVDA